MLCWREAIAAASPCLSGLGPTCLQRRPISIDLKDMCNFPGWKGASAKSFTTSGFVHHLKSSTPIAILNMSWDIRMWIKKRKFPKCWARWARKCLRDNDPFSYRIKKATFLTWQRWPCSWRLAFAPFVGLLCSAHVLRSCYWLINSVWILNYR